MHRQGGTRVLGAGTAGARAGGTSVGTGVAQEHRQKRHEGRPVCRGGRTGPSSAAGLVVFPTPDGKPEEGAEQRNDTIRITFCACVCLVNI